MSHEKEIYDLSVENGVLIARNQEGKIEKQLHKIIIFYEYEENENLDAPEGLKLVDGLNNDLYLTVDNVANISGNPFVGDFNDLKTEVIALIDLVNAVDSGAVSDLDEGFGLFASALPNGVWNTVSMDISVANKLVYIHVRNVASALTSRGVRMRAIDDAATPIWTGIQCLVGGGSTTGFWVKTNSSAQIQVLNGGNGVQYYHMNTLK